MRRTGLSNPSATCASGAGGASRSGHGRTLMTIVQSGFPTAEVRDEFAGGWPSILDGLRRAVAAKVTDRS